MLTDISGAGAVHIVCGKTDIRKLVDGLCTTIQEQFSMDINHALFLFRGHRCDRTKTIPKGPDDIVLIHERLAVQGRYRWPRDKSEVWSLTRRKFDWLIPGTDIDQPKAIRSS